MFARLDKQRKTGKREAAVIMGLIWAAATVKMFVFEVEPKMIEALATPYGVMTYSVLGFIAAMFGLDWQSKQYRAADTTRYDERLPRDDGFKGD